MRRLLMVLVLTLAAAVWPAATSAAHASSAAQAAGSLQADFNNDGFADLAVGVLHEDIGAIPDPGAVNVLYGAGNGLAAPGNQQFWQGAGGVAGVAEADDLFSWALVGSDQPTGSAAAASRSQPNTPGATPSRRR
ncbi:MAG TPA: hypothetical protein VGS14_05565 [Actinomycetes bacterium]|jgi:hypothetical protein|nr:hypothetical protein [Actinomycetes bacterium]